MSTVMISRTWLTIIAAAVATSSCQPASETPTDAATGYATLRGTVSYRERMALPPDATIDVRLEDQSRADAPATVVAAQTITAAGRQVPVPFELRYDGDRIQANRRYGVRATIRAASGALLFTTTMHHPALGGAPNDGVEILVERVGRVEASRAGAAPPAPEVGRTFVFDCDPNTSFTVRTGPGEVALWVPASLGGRYAVLAASEAASGARYEEGDIVYWNQGDSATFEIAGRAFFDCPSNPRKVPWADAARRGVTFRAVGNEPAWTLEIMPQRLTLLTELGARRTELAYAAPAVAGPRTTYRTTADGAELVAVLERRSCTDSMSGEAFEAAATVTFDGTILYGCGRFL